MRKINDINEIKKILVDILDCVSSYCVQNNIQYYLAFGTLLGSIRHDGFIPWDDDVDIMMPREDYEKFISSFSSNRYKIAEVRTDDKYFYPFAKVYDTMTIMQECTTMKSNFGIYIDVFPIDGVPNGHRFHKSFLVLLQRIIKNKYAPFDRKRSKIKQLLLPLTKTLLKPLKSHDIAKMINKISSKYPYSKYENVGISVWGYYYLSYKKNDIEPGIEHRFENGIYCVPKNYDAILKKTYGDYMKLPPKEQRVYRHGYQAYYID